MSKHAELIERLRKQCANTNGRSIEQVLDDFIGNMDEAAEALEAQAREIEGLRKDAARYRTLVDVMESAKGSADLQVNDHLGYYDTCQPGEEVSLTWFPDTPVGSYTLHGKTVSEVVDALIDHRSATHG